MSATAGRGIEGFDPATIPLEGIRLVEASAGTGKTFSLAGLYLRLVVERGADVREILAMTFTRAATQELRERLRTRLAQAARIAAETARDDREDPAEAFAETVIAAADADRDAVARRLRDAAARMDEATITTIHGFAQRAAGENAFEGTLPFDRGEQIDDAEIRREATADYWRARVVDRPAAQAGAFLELWAAPGALEQELAEVLGKPHAALVRPDRDTVERERQAALAQWPAERAAFVALLEQARDHDALRANAPLKAVLDAGGAEGLAAAIDAGLAGTVDGFPALPAVVADLGTEAGVCRHAKKAACRWFRPQELAVVAALARLQVQGRLAAAAHAADAIRALAAARKRARRLYSFDDMIAALHDAVSDPARGPALAAALRRTWPWALVDEFQDTDPLQYAILEHVYAGAADAGGGLILIGDPKQAIYGFRGGDVFAYLDAVGDADGRYGMATNHRSTGAVVAGVEALFSAGGREAFVLDGVELRHVAAARRAGDRRIELGGTELAGVTAWAIPADAGSAKQAVVPRIQAATVERIAALLEGGEVATADGERRPLSPAEIAVLVHTNDDAVSMTAALTGAGVPAVCIRPDSVLAHEPAQDLLALLRAAAMPFDAAHVRRALITPLLGYRLADLVALDTDDARWSAASELLQAAHVRWARSGVQAMLEPLLQRAAARVVGFTDGERRMTDYLHVADLLQAAEHEVFGMQGLVRWLEHAIRRAVDDGAVGEPDRVRLEDDGERVRVTTVHKAKGLQWPVVLVPYAPWLGTGGGDPTRPPLSFHDEANRAVVDLGSAAATDHAVQAARERRAEQVRLLYVALTRAEQAAFLVHGAANGAGDGPLAWLLHRADGATTGTWYGSRTCPAWLTAARAREALEARAAAAGGALAVETLAAPERPPRRQPPPAPPIAPARTDFPAPRPPWSVISFSRLAGRMAGPVEPAAGADDEPGTAAAAAAEAAAADESPEVVLHPRGTGFGRAFHELLEGARLEAWPRPGDAPGPETRRAVATSLRRHGVAIADADGRQRPVDDTAALVAATVHAPLPEIGALAAIPPARRRAELEFFLRLGGAHAADVLARMAQAGYAGARGAAAIAALRGLMHGFIDLVVEHGGRYWILDYKTNVLGPHRADYAPERLAQAAAEHRYDLQYLIYAVALHRHLRTRVPGYDPAAHLGGAIYLFVRGLGADGANGVLVDRPDPELIKALDALLDGEVAA